MKITVIEEVMQVIVPDFVPPASSGGGSGNVTGPGSAVDGDVAVFDGATGKKIKDSGIAAAALVTTDGGTADKLAFFSDTNVVSDSGIPLEALSGTSGTSPGLTNPLVDSKDGRVDVKDQDVDSAGGDAAVTFGSWYVWCKGAGPWTIELYEASLVVDFSTQCPAELTIIANENCGPSNMVTVRVHDASGDTITIYGATSTTTVLDSPSSSIKLRPHGTDWRVVG